MSPVGTIGPLLTFTVHEFCALAESRTVTVCPLPVVGKLGLNDEPLPDAGDAVGADHVYPPEPPLAEKLTLCPTDMFEEDGEHARPPTTTTLAWQVPVVPMLFWTVIVQVWLPVIGPAVKGLAGVFGPEPKFPVQEYGIMRSASPDWLQVTCEV